MNIEIEHLALQLPAGFEQRAPRIAQLLALALGQQLEGVLRPAQETTVPLGPIALLRTAPLQVQAQHSDQAIAQQLASRVAQAILASHSST